MTSANLFRKKLETFREFLVRNGAQLLEPTNEWELLRFKAGSVTSIVYRSKAGGTTWTGEADAAWNAFTSAQPKPWRPLEAPARTPRIKQVKRKPVVATLLKRDGARCFYCWTPMPVEDCTVEHLVAQTHGGPNHISNLFLAHGACNEKAGHLSAPEKIAVHVAARRGEFTCDKCYLAPTPPAVTLAEAQF